MSDTTLVAFWLMVMGVMAIIQSARMAHYWRSWTHAEQNNAIEAMWYIPFWPLMLGVLVIYGMGAGFVWVVQHVWPPPPARDKYLDAAERETAVLVNGCVHGNTSDDCPECRH